MKRVTTCLITVLFAVADVDAKPLKVFILAGQSNMDGQAKVGTFDYLGEDPNTAPMLKKMRGPDGKPVVCEWVLISYLPRSHTRHDEAAETTPTRLQSSHELVSCLHLNNN